MLHLHDIQAVEAFRWNESKTTSSYHIASHHIVLQQRRVMLLRMYVPLLLLKSEGSDTSRSSGLDIEKSSWATYSSPAKNGGVSLFVCVKRREVANHRKQKRKKVGEISYIFFKLWQFRWAISLQIVFNFCHRPHTVQQNHLITKLTLWFSPLLTNSWRRNSSWRSLSTGSTLFVKYFAIVCTKYQRLYQMEWV